MIIIIGSGNAALCAGIAALERGAKVLILEKAHKDEAHGNSRYTAGAMRFAYNSFEDLKPLLNNPGDERLVMTDFGSYSKEKFLSDLKFFNEEQPITEIQEYLVDQSLITIQWLASHNIKFDPIYSRQTFKKEGKYIFWGGLTLEAEGEGDGLVHAELTEFLKLGGEIKYGCDVQELRVKNEELKVNNVRWILKVKSEELKVKNDKTDSSPSTFNSSLLTFNCDAIILACGGFEANRELRVKYLGEMWANAKVRGTRHNLGLGIEMATNIGAALNGFFGGCHATPMDANMPEYGNLNIPFIERKHYRKISYLFGVMLNINGERFVDEGKDFRNYTYAQFGKAVLEQPQNIAFQIFDAKVDHLLYSEYKTQDATVYTADTLEDLISQLEGINAEKALETLKAYNNSVNLKMQFDPTIKDGKNTNGLILPKSNWANVLDTPPFKAYPVTGGITFTYGGLNVNTHGEVLDKDNKPIKGLYACGEIVGGVFFYGYPGGSGLTSGAVFGRSAGYSATAYMEE